MTALVAWASIGYVTIDTGSAAVAPNFGAEQVQRATSFLGRVFGFATGATFTIATALAACRLILFTTGTPASLRPLLEWEIAGVAAFGWPLVALAGTIASLIVLAVFLIAEARLEQVVQNGE